MSDEELVQRTEDEQKRALEIYDSFRDDLNKRDLSNSENYDKAILTLSSSGLAISLTFLKFIVPPENASGMWMLKWGWGLFLASVIFSLVAYIVSNRAIKKQLVIAEDYYVNKKSSAMNQKNWLSILNNYLNMAVGALFASALTLIVVFVISNVNGKENSMTEKKTEAPVVQEKVVTKESASVPNMQKAPGAVSKKSAGVPNLQAAPGVVKPTEKPASAPAPSKDKGSE